MRPWFILGFSPRPRLSLTFPLKPEGHLVFGAVQRVLVVTLFLIGSELSREALLAVGKRPLVQGFLLWLLLGSMTMAAILLGWIG